MKTFKAPVSLGRALQRARSKTAKEKLLQVYYVIYGRLPGEENGRSINKNKSRTRRK